MQGQGARIKSIIKSHLVNLVEAGSIGNYYEQDLSKDTLEGTYKKFPVVLLGMSDAQADYLTNQANLNNYKFQLIVMQKVDDVKQVTDIEDLRDLIMTEFATDPTFGLENGWVDPPRSPLPPITTPDKTYVVFLLEIFVHIASPDFAFINLANDTTPPTTPGALANTTIAGVPNLSWLYSVDPHVDGHVRSQLHGYNIYRNAVLLGKTLAGTVNFNDISAQAGHTYVYTVTAIDNAGNESTASNAVSVTL